MRKETYFGETLPGALHPAMESSAQKYTELLEQVQWRRTNIVRGWEHLSCEEKLRKFRLFSSTKRRLQGHLIAAF